MTGQNTAVGAARPVCPDCRRPLPLDDEWSSLPEGAHPEWCWGDPADCGAAADGLVDRLSERLAAVEAMLREARDTKFRHRSNCGVNFGSDCGTYRGEPCTVGDLLWRIDAALGQDPAR